MPCRLRTSRCTPTRVVAIPPSFSFRGRFRIRVKSGHKAFWNGSGLGSSGAEPSDVSHHRRNGQLEASLISERVTAGMRADEAQGKHLRRPATPPRVIQEIEVLARSTSLSIQQIQEMSAGRASRGIVGEITKRARAAPPPAL